MLVTQKAYDTTRHKPYDTTITLHDILHIVLPKCKIITK